MADLNKRMLDLLERIKGRLDEDQGDNIMFLYEEIGEVIAEAKAEHGADGPGFSGGPK